MASSSTTPAATTTTTTGNTSPPKSPSIHVREPSTTKAIVPPQSMHTLSPLNFTTPSARSPSGSMPSSPTSIHSSSSAIFERDIEQPLSAVTSNSLHLLHNKDPHHTARAVAHEPLENSVPSVLSAAATALGELEPTPSSLAAPPHSGGSSTKQIRKGMSMDDISVIAPAPLSPQHWPAGASTAGSVRLGASRSPSPHLLPLPGLPPTGATNTATSPRIARPGVPKRINTNGSADGEAAANATSVSGGPSVIDVVPPTPNANTFGFVPAKQAIATTTTSGNTSPQSSPMIVTPPLPLPRGTAVASSNSRPTSIAMSLEELSLSPLVATTADEVVPVPADVEPLAFSGSAHPRPPSPNSANNAANTTASKRLSFISYNDLLNSTPMSSFPLSSLTTGGPAEPPHQVDVTLRSPRRTRTNSRQSSSPLADTFAQSQAGARTSVFEDAGEGGSLQHSHDVGPKGGGEWEREGMGSGLEERLEAA
ncbi:hypothetical protein FRB90_003209, partial [Tulasnella sp. 427]